MHPTETPGAEGRGGSCAWGGHGGTVWGRAGRSPVTGQGNGTPQRESPHSHSCSAQLSQCGLWAGTRVPSFHPQYPWYLVLKCPVPRVRSLRVFAEDAQGWTTAYSHGAIKRLSLSPVGARVGPELLSGGFPIGELLSSVGLACFRRGPQSSSFSHSAEEPSWPVSSFRPFPYTHAPQHPERPELKSPQLPALAGMRVITPLLLGQGLPGGVSASGNGKAGRNPVPPAFAAGSF